MRLSLWVYPIFAAFLASGCAGLTEIQDSVSKFDQSVHAAVTAEESFLASVQTADCDNQFYLQAYSYAMGQAQNFAIAGYCLPGPSYQPVITTGQITTRKGLLDALALYADQMQALASSTSTTDKNLNSATTTLANNLKTLVANKQINLPTSVTSTAPALVNDIATAFTTIAAMVIDQKIYSSIKDAATKLQPQIDTIVLALEKEDGAFGDTVVAQRQSLEGHLRPLVANEKSGKFFTIIQSRAILASVSGLPDLSLGTMTPDWGASSPTPALITALEAIRTGNQQIATGTPAGLYAQAHDAYERAVSARDFYNALSASK